MGTSRLQRKVVGNITNPSIMTEDVPTGVERNGDSASLSLLSPPYNEGEKFMDKANTIICDLNDERNQRDLIVAEIAQKFRSAARGFCMTLGERVAQTSYSQSVTRQEVIADIEAEAGNIDIAEKELASFTQDLSVFAMMSSPTSARDSPGKKKMRLDPYLTNPTRGDQLFEKVQKTLVEMSKAKAENNDKMLKMNGDIIQGAEGTLSKFFARLHQSTNVFNTNIDNITGAFEDEYNEVCELENQLTAFTDGVDNFAEEVGSP